MIPSELAEQVRTEVKQLKKVQEDFLQTYQRLCAYCGGPKWAKDYTEVVSHQVRSEIIPIMEQAGLDNRAVQALCSWAETVVASLARELRS
jgi:DNA-binding ferritin-like protein (Dps family)